MKIVHVVYSLAMGGAEVLVGELCRVQRAEGHEVSVFAYAELGAVGERLGAEGFAIYVPGEAHPLRTIGRYFRKFVAMRPDVVHCHNVAATIQGAVSARMAGVRRVISTRHSLVAPPYDRAEERKYAVAAACCDWVVGVCEATSENLRGAPWARRGARRGKIVTVYNGATRPALEDAGEMAREGFTLLFVGRLAAVKDLGTLVRAVASAAVRVPGLALWVVGDGPVRGELEGLVAELGVGGTVRFWGQRMDTGRFFAAADGFAMSSVSEGLPMSLVQAMSAGLPAVTTDVGGMGEVLRLSGGGLLAPVGDVAGMAAAIVRLAEDAGLRAELGAKGQAAYEREFTVEAMAAGYMKLYLGR